MTSVCITIDTEGDAAYNANSTFFGIKIIVPRLLRLFKKHRVKATFFIQEDRICQIATKFYDLVREIEDQGHEIGLHSHGLIRASVVRKN